MPTRDGQKSVQDALDIGHAYLTISGLPAKVQHRDNCRHDPATGWGCRCGLRTALDQLVMNVDRVLDQFGASCLTAPHPAPCLEDHK